MCRHFSSKFIVTCQVNQPQEIRTFAVLQCPSKNIKGSADVTFLLRLVHTYDASTSISHVWTGTTQARERVLFSCACACVVPVHTWLAHVRSYICAYTCTRVVRANQPLVLPCKMTRGECVPTPGTIRHNDVDRTGKEACALWRHWREITLQCAGTPV